MEHSIPISAFTEAPHKTKPKPDTSKTQVGTLQPHLQKTNLPHPLPKQSLHLSQNPTHPYLKEITPTYIS